MEKAHEAQQLEIGKKYLVAHAVMVNECGSVPMATLSYIPIIPILHKDKQFGVDIKHYHHDGRFAFTADKSLGNFMVDDKGKTNHIIYDDPKFQGGNKVLRIVYKQKECIRLTTGIKPPRRNTKHYKEGGKKYHEWYQSMIGQSCAGKRCPHLGAIMIEEKGKLVCPLHKLKGNIKTEKVI